MENPSETDAVSEAINKAWEAQAPHADVEGAWDRLTQQVTQAESASSRPTRAMYRWEWRMGITSALALATVVAVIGLWQVTLAGRSAAMREFVTPVGGRATVVLRDGTRLTLGPASRVRVPTDYGRRERSLDLEGEAFLTVVHDRRHPLTIHTGQTIITDIGTAFDVRHYDDDREVRVAVTEGEVAVGSTHLVAGDLAMVHDAAIAVTHHADVATLVGWTQGHLAFADTPLHDVVRTIERTFDLHIIVADSALAGQHVTASFTDQNADLILDEVTSIVGAEYRRTGREVTIKTARNTSTHTPSGAASPYPLSTATTQHAE